jgi:hypothetical protein
MMRVLTKSAFLALPPGTIFCKGKPWFWEDLSVKADTLASDDFGYRTWQWVSANDSGAASDAFERSLSSGESIPIEDAYGRDGCFDNEDLFLVFESADLLSMRADIDAALSALPT